MFKVWTAERVERGVQYVVGQHGNNYGTHRYINPSVEEATSDKFITWGWSGHLPQHVSGFNLKLPAKSQLHADPQGGLLLSEVWAGHRTTTWDNSQQFLDYLRDQFAFVGGLSPSVRSRLSVRLHHDWARLDWNEPQRWKQYAPDLELDYGFESIRSKIGRARLIVHSYDSTGMLETLAQGIPTLAFWQNRFGHLRDEVRADYQRLVDVGIVHLRADTAAATVNENWDRLDEWWGEEKRRAAVRGFCEKYSRRSFNPASEMVRILLND